MARSYEFASLREAQYSFGCVVSPFSVWVAHFPTFVVKRGNRGIPAAQAPGEAWFVTKLDPIWHRARADLIIGEGNNGKDVFLWEQSSRVAQTALRIAHLPEVSVHAIDEAALVAAALYHEAAWIGRLREGTVSSPLAIDIYARGEQHRELGALMMEERLADLLEPESLALASAAIRTLDDRSIESIEGQIVCEARTLNKFGAASFWVVVRRGLLEDRGVQAAIDTWRRQREYHYWTALLRSAFRFDSVRELAKRRFSLLDRFMEELEQQHNCDDLAV